MSTPDTDLLPPPPPFTAPAGRLRRSRSDRVGAGVAGGLGEYFGVDPVLFRVLFATSAFFGGAGILAYLLSWAAIPDAGTERAAVDGWIAALRRRQVPFWVVAVGAGALLWLVAFSWWAPGPIFPVMAVVVLLVVAFTRSGRRASAPAPISLQKGVPAPPVSEARGWLAESLDAGRERRRRAAPVRIATLAALVVTLAVLGIADAASGIIIPAYLWAAFGIVLAGLLVGAALRRTPWSVALLLIPIVGGLFAFAGTRASLHDGSGQQEWRPTTAPAADYRLAFGQGTLDLRKLPAQSAAHDVDVTMAAGQVRILAPRTLNLTVVANIHLGLLTVDGRDYSDDTGPRRGGFNFNRTIDPPAGATGTPIKVTVHLADGNVDIVRR